ncbi:hypothetical protein ACQKEY_12860 [Lysinibacillus fusiformis]
MWKALVKDMYKFEMNGAAIISTVTLLIYGLVSLIKDIIGT